MYNSSTSFFLFEKNSSVIIICVGTVLTEQNDNEHSQLSVATEFAIYFSLQFLGIMYMNI